MVRRRRGLMGGGGPAASRPHLRTLRRRAAAPTAMGTMAVALAGAVISGAGAATVAAPTPGGRPPASREPPAAVEPPAANPRLADLAWMAGTWIGEEDGTVMEEQWLPPRGTVMPGVHRDVFPGGRTFFEFLRIEATPDGIVYRASPRGAPPTSFPLKSLEVRRVVFENPEHDHPQRILYWLDADGRLHARVESETDGKVRAAEWVWRRAPRPE